LLEQLAEIVRQRPQTVPREARDMGERRDMKFDIRARREEAVGVTFEQATLGHDFERVTVQVQRLVEALREAEVNCPGDRAHSFHSQ